MVPNWKNGKWGTRQGWEKLFLAHSSCPSTGNTMTLARLAQLVEHQTFDTISDIIGSGVRVSRWAKHFFFLFNFPFLNTKSDAEHIHICLKINNNICTTLIIYNSMSNSTCQKYLCSNCWICKTNLYFYFCFGRYFFFIKTLLSCLIYVSGTLSINFHYGFYILIIP